MRELTVAVIALFSIMCGAAVASLTWLASLNVPAAILAGLTSTGACIVATIQLLTTIASWGRPRRDDRVEDES